MRKSLKVRDTPYCLEGKCILRTVPPKPQGGKLNKLKTPCCAEMVAHDEQQTKTKHKQQRNDKGVQAGKPNMPAEQANP